MSIAQKLAALREKKGCSVKEAAAAAKVRVKTMEQYESGKAIPKLKTITRLYEFYGYSTKELFKEAVDSVNAAAKEADKVNQTEKIKEDEKP